MVARLHNFHLYMPGVMVNFDAHSHPPIFEVFKMHIKNICCERINNLYILQTINLEFKHANQKIPLTLVMRDAPDDFSNPFEQAQ